MKTNQIYKNQQNFNLKKHFISRANFEPLVRPKMLTVLSLTTAPGTLKIILLRCYQNTTLINAPPLSFFFQLTIFRGKSKKKGYWKFHLLLKVKSKKSFSVNIQENPWKGIKIITNDIVWPWKCILASERKLEKRGGALIRDN